jgi:hypothetical protein
MNERNRASERLERLYRGRKRIDEINDQIDKLQIELEVLHALDDTLRESFVGLLSPDGEIETVAFQDFFSVCSPEIVATCESLGSDGLLITFSEPLTTMDLNARERAEQAPEKDQPTDEELASAALDNALSDAMDALLKSAGED